MQKGFQIGLLRIVLIDEKLVSVCEAFTREITRKSVEINRQNYDWFNNT